MDGMNSPRLTIIRPKRREQPPVDGILKHRFRVGRYTVRMVIDLDATLPGAQSQTRVEWVPDLPPPGTLTAREIKEYVRGRNALQQKVANITGGRILVADI